MVPTKERTPGRTKPKTTINDPPIDHDAKENNKFTTWGASWILACFVVVVAVAVNNQISLTRYLAYRHLPSALWPINLPSMLDLPEFSGSNVLRRFWGTYRPGLYFGVRSKSPQSTLMGLMWTDPQDYNALDSIRHEARQSDGIKKWGWQAHDGESFGRQRLEDGDVGLEIFWQKSDSNPEDWSVRLHVFSLDSSLDLETDVSQDDGEFKARTVFVYFANENSRAVLSDPAGVSQAIAADSPVEPTGCSFWSKDVKSDWCAYLRPLGTFKGAVHHLGSRTRHFHNLTELVKEGLIRSLINQRTKGAEDYSLVLPNEQEDESNVSILQITAILPMTIDISFVKGGIEAHSAEARTRAEALSGASLSAKLQSSEKAFEKKFKRLFGDLTFSYQASKYGLSNMLGGLGYWYGHSLVSVQGDSTKMTSAMWDRPLFSAVPSRSFFPRGFLWDEGFHQILIRRWNPSLSREILSHWLNLMAASGWIAREQILGMESRTRVPDEFVPQSPDAANPPTLFLVLAEMVDKISSGETYEDKHLDMDFLKHAWPRLDAWFTWYNQTQHGPVPGSYRWRGRDQDTDKELNPKTLTSGLDDFPRASHPSDYERHLDLRCWMALAARAMARISYAIDAPRLKQRDYSLLADRLENYDELKTLHWDEEHSVFADYGLDTSSVELEEYRDDRNQMSWRRTLINESVPRLGFVHHVGYVTMFPLALGLIPKEAPEVHKYLDTLTAPENIWSEFGLRSLSSSSSLYDKRNTPHDPPYWRGAVWINMNFLVVDALKRVYSGSDDPLIAEKASNIAKRLSANVVNNIVKEYNKTGFLFENYDDKTGEGRGCHPFTGWTALVSMM